MMHYDEHTIGLFALGSEKVENSRREFLAHVEVCSGCREKYDELVDFHAQMRGDQNLLAEANGPNLIRSLSPTVGIGQLITSEVRPLSIQMRFGKYVRSHPAGASFAALLIIGSLALTFNLTKTSKNANPAHTFLDVRNNSFEVYSEEDALLWSIPIPNASELSNHYGSLNINHTIVTDLKNKGQNQVVTLVARLREKPLGNLYVYNGGGSLLQRMSPEVSSLEFRGAPYTSQLLFQSVAVWAPSKSDMQTIFATMYGSRSPACLASFASDGSKLGRYWHFGFMHLPAQTDSISGLMDGKVLVASVNDSEEMQEGRWAELIVLDPAKLVGEGECSTTRGFGLTKSAAELFCIRFPQSDLEKYLGTPEIPAIFIEGDKVGAVTRTTHPSGSTQFEYLFSRDFRVIDVKYPTQALDLHKKLKEAKKISSVLDAQYLLDLKNSVEYWDGSKWGRRWTMVRAPE